MSKFSVAIGLLVTGSLGVMGGLAVGMGRQSVREQVLTANRMAATLVARAVEQYVADAVSIMREAPGRPKLSREIRDGNWPEVTKVLENFLQHFHQFDYVAVQDSSGILRARVPHAETIGQDFSFRDFFREAVRTRELYVSGVFVSKAAQRPVVAIAVPVLDGPEAVKGVLVGALSLRVMSDFIATIGHDDGGHIYLVDAAGALIAQSTGPTPGPFVERRAQPVVEAVLAGQSGSMELREPESGETLLAAYVPITRLGWGVVAARPTATAYAAEARLTYWLGAIALGCMVGAVLLGWGLARTLTGPLGDLTQAAGRMAGGDFFVRVRSRGEDEVAGLASAFNTMAEEIQRSYDRLSQSTAEVEVANQDLVREVAERRRAEGEVRRLNAELERRVVERTRQLEAVNCELEAFTYTASHDLKAPLRGIEGFARALDEDYRDYLDATGRHYLERIQGSARHMGELIDDLLRYSRLERRPMTRKQVALRPLLEEVCNELTEEIQGRGLKVRMELGVEEVDAEREGLREALANLVGNAVKFTREPGGAVTINSAQDGNTVIVSCADTGIGFDMKYRDRIFQIFERLHRPEEFPGTGVGLAIVRKVAERHGGRAWAVSEPGKGSTFFLALAGTTQDGI